MAELQKTSGIAFAAAPWPLMDRPTVVFIHGSGGSHQLWSRQLAADDGRLPYNAVAIDLPGHGASDGPACDDVAAYTETLARWLEQMRFPAPIPCGLSIGGAIVQQLLLDCPDLFAAGILTCTGARLKVLPAIFETIAADYPGFVKMVGTMGASVKTDAAVLQPILDATAACPPEVTAGDFRACDRFDVMGRLEDIAHPVLVVSALEDRLTPPKYGQFLADHIPHAQYEQIPDAGHLLPLEQPEALNRAIARFILTLASGDNR